MTGTAMVRIRQRGRSPQFYCPALRLPPSACWQEKVSKHAPDGGESLDLHPQRCDFSPHRRIRQLWPLPQPCRDPRCRSRHADTRPRACEAHRAMRRLRAGPPQTDGRRHKSGAGRSRVEEADATEHQRHERGWFPSSDITGCHTARALRSSVWRCDRWVHVGEDSLEQVQSYKARDRRRDLLITSESSNPLPGASTLLDRWLQLYSIAAAGRSEPRSTRKQARSQPRSTRKQASCEDDAT
jgi:hypothetical protein